MKYISRRDKPEMHIRTRRELFIRPLCNSRIDSIVVGMVMVDCIIKVCTRVFIKMESVNQLPVYCIKHIHVLAKYKNTFSREQEISKRAH